MRTRTLALILGAAVLMAAAHADRQFEETEEPQYEEDEAYEEDEGAGSGWLDHPAWRDFTARIQRHVDADGLLRARRYANIVNGVLLGVTGPVALAISTFGLKLSNIVLSLYVTGIGGLLTGLELGLSPIAPWVAENLSYLSTGNGRTALLAFAGNLVWAFGRTGLVPALLTCVNAIFNANFQKLLSFVQEDDEVVDVSDGTPSEAAADASAAVEGEPAAELAVEEDHIVLNQLREQLEAVRQQEAPAAAKGGYAEDAEAPPAEPTPAAEQLSSEAAVEEDSGAAME